MNRCLALLIVTLTTLTVAGLTPNSATAQVRDWNDRTGTWSDVSKWNPNLIPGVADLVRIGILPASFDADVELDVNTAISGLQIFDGMSLRTNDHNLQVVFDTLITGSNGRSSELRVQNASFGTRDLVNEARLRLDAGTLNVSRQLNNTESSIIFGGGIVNLTRDSNVAMRNDGTIFTNGQPSLTFNQLGTGLIDLDGSTGDGYLRIVDIATPQTVNFNGTQLADSFSGRIDVGAGNTLNMNLSNGWTADSFSEINFRGNSVAVTPAVIQGEDWNFNGHLNVQSDNFQNAGSGRVEANTVIGNTADIFIEQDNSLDFAGNVTINGGNFLLEEDTELSFSATTLVSGGTFTTHNDLSSDGSVIFAGLTAWNGDVTVNGIARQNGNAVVADTTTINAGILDMDGGGNTNWSISHELVINANGIDSTISNSFDGSMIIQGGLQTQLTINLDQPDEHWTMAGEMSLSNALNVGLYRVGGSRMRVTGDLNVDGRVGIRSDLTIENSAVVAFADSETVLFTDGTTLVNSGSDFIGEGTLVNMGDGELTLADGVTLNDVGLENHGILQIGNSPGIINVDSFDNFASGELRIDIGGYLAGDEFDAMLVSGDVELDGTLEVELSNLGFGLFEPEVGDQFQILTSLGQVSGTFANNPISFAGGRTYHWDVNYHAHDVQLELTSIGVPEPSSMIPLVLCTALLMLRDRRNPFVFGG